ncbi:hypothetical protein HK101_006086, partial [Irineochytrium annulatum]
GQGHGGSPRPDHVPSPKPDARVRFIEPGDIAQQTTTMTTMQISTQALRISTASGGMEPLTLDFGGSNALSAAIASGLTTPPPTGLMTNGNGSRRHDDADSQVSNAPSSVTVESLLTVVSTPSMVTAHPAAFVPSTPTAASYQMQQGLMTTLADLEVTAGIPPSPLIDGKPDRQRIPTPPAVSATNSRNVTPPPSDHPPAPISKDNPSSSIARIPSSSTSTRRRYNLHDNNHDNNHHHHPSNLRPLLHLMHHLTSFPLPYLAPASSSSTTRRALPPPQSPQPHHLLHSLLLVRRLLLTPRHPSEPPHVLRAPEALLLAGAMLSEAHLADVQTSACAWGLAMGWGDEEDGGCGGGSGARRVAEVRRCALVRLHFETGVGKEEFAQWVEVVRAYAYERSGATTRGASGWKEEDLSSCSSGDEDDV